MTQDSEKPADTRMTWITLPADRLAWIAQDSRWQPWMDKGWTLRPGRTAGAIVAVHETLKQATLDAKRLETLVSRLEKGDWSYYHYMKLVSVTKESKKGKIGK